MASSPSQTRQRFDLKAACAVAVFGAAFILYLSRSYAFEAAAGMSQFVNSVVEVTGVSQIEVGDAADTFSEDDNEEQKSRVAEPIRFDRAPNVLFIMVDDLKPALGCYGDAFAKTPNIDALAAKSVVFERAYANEATCGPSRSSILTGTRPDVNGVWTYHKKLRSLNKRIVTLPQYFKEKGYEVRGTGKIFDGRNTESARVQDKRSWTHPLHNPYKSKQWLGPVEEGFREPIMEFMDVEDAAYNDGNMTMYAIDMIRHFAENEEKPWFFAVGFHKPHLPFTAPQKYFRLYEKEAPQLAEFQSEPKDAFNGGFHISHEPEMYRGFKNPPPEETQRNMIRGYYAAVSYVDAQIGKLVGALDSHRGMSQRTIVCLLGDHGWHLGDHGLWGKSTVFEQATRSPLMISIPGLQPRVVRSPVEFVDIFPTIVDLAFGDGLMKPKIKNQLDGVSLSKVMRNERLHARAAAVSQYPAYNRDFVSHVQEYRDIMGYSLRTHKYRLVAWVKHEFDGYLTYPGKRGHPTGKLVKPLELYDYARDPEERENVAERKEYARVMQNMVELWGFRNNSWKGLGGLAPFDY